jgi:hypothetical protein
MSNVVRMWKAAAPHKRAHWQMAREIQATAAFEVVECGGAWFVLEAGQPKAGPMTNGAAWDWIDRHTARRRYGG